MNGNRWALARGTRIALPGSAPLHGRHRNKNGEVSKKHGNTLIGTLRETYGPHFAEGHGDHEKLSDVLHKLDEPSLRQLASEMPFRGSNAAALLAEATSLYEHDVVFWSDAQAGLLRQVAAGKRPAGIDWENIVEEIESVGRSQVNAVESLLLQTLVHEFKILLWPDTRYVEGWRNESLLFQAQAAQQFTPSMRQKIDVLKLVSRATRALPRAIDGVRYSPHSLVDVFDRAQREVSAWMALPDDPSTRAITLTGIEPPAIDFFQRGT